MQPCASAHVSMRCPLPGMRSSRASMRNTRRCSPEIRMAQLAEPQTATVSVHLDGRIAARPLVIGATIESRRDGGVHSISFCASFVLHGATRDTLGASGQSMSYDR